MLYSRTSVLNYNKQTIMYYNVWICIVECCVILCYLGSGRLKSVALLTDSMETRQVKPLSHTQRSYCTVPDIVMFAVSCPQGKYGKSRAHKTSVDKTSQRCQHCLINSA